MVYLLSNIHLHSHDNPLSAHFWRMKICIMLGIDLMRPFLKSSYVNKHLLVIVYYCSKCVKLFPLRTATTSVIAVILTKEIFTRWGTQPTSCQIVDHNSLLTSSTSSVVSGVSKLNTAYHPHTNITERTNWTLRFILAAYVRHNHKKWDQ